MNEELTDLQIQELEIDLKELVSTLKASIEASQNSTKNKEIDHSCIGRITRMGALQEVEMAKAAKAANERRSMLAKQALGFIVNGTYGECRVCGESIGYPRLKVAPETPFCLECQSSRER